MGGSDVHDMSYYGKCMVGGIFSCGLTHMAVCPLDIVKCRKQVNYPSSSLEAMQDELSMLAERIQMLTIESLG
jgi:Mitochondrial carrier protein